jgi:hypothetical protein
MPLQGQPVQLEFYMNPGQLPISLDASNLVIPLIGNCPWEILKSVYSAQCCGRQCPSDTVTVIVGICALTVVRVYYSKNNILLVLCSRALRTLARPLFVGRPPLSGSTILKIILYLIRARRPPQLPFGCCSCFPFVASGPVVCRCWASGVHRWLI